MKKRIALTVVTVIGAVIAGLVLSLVVLVMTNRIVPFRHGLVSSNAFKAQIALEDGEIEKLDSLHSLRAIDLTGSTCYDEIDQWQKQHPNVEVTYTVELPSRVPVDTAAKTCDLTRFSEGEALDIAQRYLRFSPDIVAVKIDASTWSDESLEAFTQACPNIDIMGTYQIDGLEVSPDTTDLDLTDASVEKLEALSRVANGLDGVKTLEVGDEDGHKKLDAVGRIAKANPDLKVSYTFTAFGKRIDINDTTLDFRGLRMDDQGEEVRQIMAAMPKVETLDMDQCGVDDEHMAAIRDEFPNTEVIWRIWFGSGYTVRTDTDTILASDATLGGSLDPENSTGLKYCTKVKYMDIGHSGCIQDISFVSYMPDLEVFICMKGEISDISPLANCPHLEFLECFSNNIQDLSPLAACKELKHLNSSNNPPLDDISCLYDLDLERFYCNQYNSVPADQFETYQQLHPNCEMSYNYNNPHDGWRDGAARYELLQKQFHYPDYYSYVNVPDNDPLYVPMSDTVASDATVDKDENAQASKGNDTEQDIEKDTDADDEQSSKTSKKKQSKSGKETEEEDSGVEEEPLDMTTYDDWSYYEDA